MSVKIIAEAGVNHNGDFKIAKKLIDIASDAGADFIKFQTFKTENVISKNAFKANYQIKATSDNISLYAMLKKLELTNKEFISLKKYSKNKIDFLSTPHDLKSIDFLANLGQKYIKIASGDLTNFPMLKKISLLKNNVILSTGMANMEEIEKALLVLQKNGLKDHMIILLHCTSEYPAPMNEVNLKAMLKMKEYFKLKVGLSDHTVGNEVAIAAVALGAVIIEKHFTLDKKMNGPDHSSSLNPNELKILIDKVKNISKALGNGQKVPSKSEVGNIPVIRKSIVASKPIKIGEIFSDANLEVKRPGNGISPMLWEKLIGTKATKNYKIDDQIKII